MVEVVVVAEWNSWCVVVVVVVVEEDKRVVVDNTVDTARVDSNPKHISPLHLLISHSLPRHHQELGNSYRTG